MANVKPLRRHRSRERAGGQSLVEFALVLPILLLLIFGVLDFGRAIYLNSTLSQAAREGARLAAVEAGWMGSNAASCNDAGGPVCPPNVTQLRTNILGAANRMMVPFGEITNANLFTQCAASGPGEGAQPVGSQTCAGPSSGNFVTVRVRTTFTAITPLIEEIVGTLELDGQATMVIN